MDNSAKRLVDDYSRSDPDYIPECLPSDGEEFRECEARLREQIEKTKRNHCSGCGAALSINENGNGFCSDCSDPTGTNAGNCSIDECKQQPGSLGGGSKYTTRYAECDEALIPVHINDTHRKHVPELRLLESYLLFAVMDYSRGCRDARAWFNRMGWEPFEFLWTCEFLNIDYKLLLKTIGNKKTRKRLAKKQRPQIVNRKGYGSKNKKTLQSKRVSRLNES